MKEEKVVGMLYEGCRNDAALIPTTFYLLRFV